MPAAPDIAHIVQIRTGFHASLLEDGKTLLPAREGIARDVLPADGLGVSPGNGCVHLPVYVSVRTGPCFVVSSLLRPSVLP